MRSVVLPGELLVLEVDGDELGLLLDACLEASRVLRGDAFETVMGVPRAELHAVEDVLYAGYRAMVGATDGTAEPPQGTATMRCTVRSHDAVTLRASRHEVEMLVDAFVQTDRLIEDWEFETLMGVTKTEFAVVKDDLLVALRATPNPG